MESIETTLAEVHEKRNFKLGKKDLVLDIGVGTGGSTFDLAKHARYVIGIDKDEKQLEIVRNELKKRQIKNVELIKGDVRALNILFKEKHFDFINCFAAFHYFSNPSIVLSEINLVLKTDGIFTIFDPMFISDTREKWKEMTSALEKVHPEGDQYFYTEKDYSKMRNAADFTIKQKSFLNLKDI